VLSLADVFHDAGAKLYTLFIEGKMQEAEELNFSLIALNKELSGSFGVGGGAPRRPLLSLTEAQRETLKASLSKSQFAR
jgi:dihydrodipicolinate synthase/N-acetylneuraminate lyase